MTAKDKDEDIMKLALAMMPEDPDERDAFIAIACELMKSCKDDE
jgi:hypothetical protein